VVGVCAWPGATILGLCLAWGGEGAACGAEAPKEASAAQVPEPPSGPFLLDGEAAFDLVATAGGALLVAATPSGELRAHVLDARGGALGEPRSLARATRVDEVAVAAARGRVAVLYRGVVVGGGGDADGERPAVYRVLLDPEALAPSPPERLADGAPGSPQRGRLALAVGPSGELGALFQVEDGPCHEGPGCARFSFRRLQEPGDERRGVGLATSAPCPAPLAGYVQGGGVWFYGLCTVRDGAPETMVYAIQFEPRYAVAEPALPGAWPRGLATLGTTAVLIADAPGGPAAAAFPSATEARRPLNPRRQLRCDSAGPQLALGAMEVPLADVAGDLAAVLPPDLAPDGSRAAWTGERLLVAEPQPGDAVRLRRHRCEGASLVADSR
ncbi:MAG: hypothetical protein AAF447_28370, partial [Myxococcota bacterium]